MWSPCFWASTSVSEPVSLFRFVKYSSILFFLGRHRTKLFRSLAVLLFAVITTLLYDDVRVYLEARHPETLIYALIAKIVIVYGALVFVLLQFRPGAAASDAGEARAAAVARKPGSKSSPDEAREPDRLDALADVDSHRKLQSRYDRILQGQGHAPPGPRDEQ